MANRMFVLIDTRSACITIPLTPAPQGLSGGSLIAAFFFFFLIFAAEVF